MRLFRARRGRCCPCVPLRTRLPRGARSPSGTGSTCPAPGGAQDAAAVASSPRPPSNVAAARGAGCKRAGAAPFCPPALCGVTRLSHLSRRGELPGRPALVVRLRGVGTRDADYKVEMDRIDQTSPSHRRSCRWSNRAAPSPEPGSSPGPALGPPGSLAMGTSFLSHRAPCRMKTWGPCFQIGHFNTAAGRALPAQSPVSLPGRPPAKLPLRVM